MFYYRVEFWDEIDQRQREESGLLAAKSYGEAATRAAEYYGEKNVSSVYVEEWEDVISEDDVMEGFEKADVKA